MKNILMLDLEGVLVHFGDIRSSNVGTRDPRPYAQEFVDALEGLFDEVYLNTCVRKEPALLTLKEEFKITSFKHYPWKESLSKRTNIMVSEGYKEWYEIEKSVYLGKTVGYENFQSSKVVHVEDGLSDIEEKRINELGIIYFPVRSWGLMLSTEERRTDNELIILLDNIKALF